MKLKNCTLFLLYLFNFLHLFILFIYFLLSFLLHCEKKLVENNKNFKFQIYIFYCRNLLLFLYKGKKNLNFILI